MTLPQFTKLKPNRKEIVLLLLCLLIGFTLRVYTFDQKSLWMDEIHTFNDSRDGIQGQIKFYKENPTYLHPPLFYLLTHLFYPFSKPERDIRILPLLFGSLSILFIYFLSRSFSPDIALPCTLSLTLMAYHISLSQDGRSYALILFFGIAGLTFLMKHLETLKRGYLFLVALFYTLLFYTSYSAVPFIALSQVLWFYQVEGEKKKPKLSSFILLNGLIFLFCLPWVLFLIFNYKGQPMMHPLHTEDPGSFWSIMYWILHDWVPYAPLMIVSSILLILFPFFAHHKKNALLLLGVFLLPVGGLYLFCRVFTITHFVTSRYFITFLPIFLICLYLSILAIERRLDKLKRFLRLRILFLVLFIASNLVILSFYYRSEKQDFKGLVTYLKGHLREGDRIFDAEMGFMPGILHYFGAVPEGRHQIIPFKRGLEKKVEFQKSFLYQNKIFTLYHTKTCCDQYIADGNRLWIIVGKWNAEKIFKKSPAVLKGYFDGSFLNFARFPTDASMYLFLWDPLSPDEKGIDLPIE